jgi:hypothetical protein
MEQLERLNRDPTLTAEALAPTWIEKQTSAADRQIDGGQLEQDRQEQQLLVQRLLRRVDYDGASKKVSLVFRPSAIGTLTNEENGHTGEKMP